MRIRPTLALGAAISFTACATAPHVIASPATTAACTDPPPAATDDAGLAALREFAARCAGTVPGAEALARVGDGELARGDDLAAVDAYLRVVCAPAGVASRATRLAVDPRGARACTPLVDQAEVDATIWARVGQIYFDAGDLARAGVSFEAAMAFTDVTPSTRERIVYMHAWTLYRADRYPEALDAFASLAEGATSELRDEALTYLAILVAEPDWDVDGLPDAAIDTARPEVHALLAAHPMLGAEVLWRAGGMCFDQSEYRRASAYDALLLQRFAGSPHEADALQRMSRARERLGPM